MLKLQPKWGECPLEKVFVMVSLSFENSALEESFRLPFPVRRFTVAEYELMARAGILDEDDNVELLEGWIVPKMTKNPFHESVIAELDQAFRSRLPLGYHIRIQSALSTADSTPEPDLAIVKGAPRDYRQRHPQSNDVALVVEVADSSLARDRIKGRLYARAGIAQYWIVNLRELCVEVFRNPSGSDDAHYETGVKYSCDETLEVILPGSTHISVPISEFLSASETD